MTTLGHNTRVASQAAVHTVSAYMKFLANCCPETLMQGVFRICAVVR